MVGVDVAVSYASSSAVNGDTRSGPIAGHYFGSPFAVGAGATASAQQAAEGKGTNWVVVGALALAGIVAVASIQGRE